MIRSFRAEDAAAVARIAAAGARSESDFVLNPMWQTEEELWGELRRHGVEAEERLLVADAGGEVVGASGFLATTEAGAAGLLCPVVERSERGRGFGGELLREALSLGAERLGVRLATAGLGSRNRGGYALLAAHGFRPVRQHFLMRCERRPARRRAPLAGLVLEPATPEDRPEIHALYSACGFEARDAEAMRAVFEDPAREHAVARREGKVVAFVELETHWPRRVWVAFVGVDPAVRDRGVGSALVAVALARRFQEGAEEALLLLSPANRTALRAYEKVGFRRYRTVDVLERALEPA